MNTSSNLQKGARALPSAGGMPLRTIMTIASEPGIVLYWDFGVRFIADEAKRRGIRLLAGRR
jgi:hypothetical protein